MNLIRKLVLRMSERFRDMFTFDFRTVSFDKTGRACWCVLSELIGAAE